MEDFFKPADDDDHPLYLEKDISPNADGKLLKTLIKKGTGWQTPSNGDKVIVHYVGKLLNGTQFDSSYERGERFEFTLGAKEVIEGWDIAVKTMKRGETALFKIDSSLAYGSSGSLPTIPPNATLFFEIELYDWRLEDITKKKDGGVYKRVLTDGEGWDTPNKGATCHIEYTGYYNDKPFETRDVTFHHGEGSEENIVPAIEIAVRKMKKNEVCEIFAKHSYVFGEGVGKPEFGIPNDYESVKYVITLKSFENVKDTFEMDGEEKIEQAVLIKAKGTKYFKESKYKLAIKQYKRVIQYLGVLDDFDKKNRPQAEETLLAGYLNLAMCYLKTENFLEAEKNCEKALQIDPNNAKGLFRRGQAFFGQKEYELSKKDFVRLLEIDPNNSAAKTQVISCLNKIKEHREKEKIKYKNMFEIFAKQDSEKGKAKPSTENGHWENSASGDDKAPATESA